MIHESIEFSKHKDIGRYISEIIEDFSEIKQTVPDQLEEKSLYALDRIGSYET
jgi:hypothetical protein